MQKNNYWKKIFWKEKWKFCPNRDIKKLLKNYDSSLYGKYNKLHKILIAFNDDSIEFGRFDTIDTKYFKE